MTNNEKLMYQILGNISNTDTPIIFKGALITKLILSDHGFTDVERMTKDIDGDWIGTPPTMKHLEDTLNNSLGGLKNQYFVKAYRQYESEKSAGFYVVDKDTNKNIFKMDIAIKPTIGSKLYYFGDMTIKGVLPTEVLADKITAMSSNKLFRRMKDVTDIYALSHCVEVETDKIWDICKEKNHEVQSFDGFYNRKSEVEHAYNMLRGVDGKPDFDVIYTYISKFVKPFAEKIIGNKVWNSDKAAWRDVDVRAKGKPSLIARLDAADKKIKAEYGAARSDKTKSAERD